MKSFARRIAIVIGAVAVSAGVMTTTAGAAQADSSWPAIQSSSSGGVVLSARDSSWPA